MKGKILALMILVSAGVYAGGYEHSFGVTLGTINGLSYKGFVSNNLHFVLQVDAYWQMGLTTNWTEREYFTVGNANSYVQTVNRTRMDGTDYQSVMLEPTFMYQGKIGRWNLGNMYWFAGGGVGFGMLWRGTFDQLSLWCKPDEEFRPWFKCSQHVMMGVEFCFNDAPLCLGIELRPGMAEGLVTSGGSYAEGQKTINGVIFDWGASFSLRYCFGEEKVKRVEK